MGFSGNLVAFGFEDDIIIYEKLVEVIDNILVGLLQTYKPQSNPLSFSDFFNDPYQNIVFWSKGLFPKEFKQRISILLDDIQKLYNNNLNLHNRVRFIEYDEKHPEYKLSIYKMFNSTIYKMHFIPYTDSAVHIASDIYTEFYEQGYALPDLETAEEGVFFFGFDGDEALAFVHTTNKLVEISFDNLYDTYHEL
jgi:hypothetical protein